MYHSENGFAYTSNVSHAVSCGSCLSPPVLALPPVRSIEMSDVTAPPPAIEAPLPVFRIVERMEFRILPYVVASPRSIAWMKQNVIAPVEVIFDKAEVSADV